MAGLKVYAIPHGCNYFSCSPFNRAHILCQISWSIVLWEKNLIYASVSCLITKDKLKLKRHVEVISFLPVSGARHWREVCREERFINTTKALKEETNHMAQWNPSWRRIELGQFAASPSSGLCRWVVWSLAELKIYDCQGYTCLPPYPLPWAHLLQALLLGVLASHSLALGSLGQPACAGSVI